MTARRNTRWWSSLGLGLALGGLPSGVVSAADVVWRPVDARPIASTQPLPSAAPALGPASAPRVSSGVSLGRPLSLSPAVTSGATDLPPLPVVRSMSASSPSGVVQVQGIEPPPPVPPPGVPGPPPVPPPIYSPVPPAPGMNPVPSPGDLYNSGVVADPLVPGAAAPGGVPPGGSWLDKAATYIPGASKRHPFQSDHCFDTFISPVSNPFYFEDPRSLTEARPIFMLQTIPSDNWGYNGGNLYWFGTQFRVAFTDQFSFVLNKLGGIWIDPDAPSDPAFDQGSGFAELWLGPKFTFYRNERSGTLFAAGLTFQIPIGTGGTVYQNIGDLSLVPYLSAAQSFGRSSYGTFNSMGTLGYSFSTSSARTDNFFLSAHLDYDVANLHKFYPFLEMNWTIFTSNGLTFPTVPLNFEGRDVITYGSANVSSNQNLTLAPGFRFKANECVQFGTAFEFPVVGRKDILNFRWTVDMIFRY